MDPYKVFRFMERVWLIMALGFFLWSAWLLTATRWDEAKVPLFATVCATILYVLRRYQRRKMDRAIAEKAEQEKKK